MKTATSDVQLHYSIPEDNSVLLCLLLVTIQAHVLSSLKQVVIVI